MRKLYSILSVLMILLVVSCGESKKEVKVKPETKTIKGVLKNCYEIVDKEYPIKKDYMYYLITVELRKINDELPFNPEDSEPFGVSSGKATHVGFGIELLDKSGNIIMVKQATGDGFNGPYSSDDVQALINLQKDEMAIIRWSVDEDKYKEVVSFRITSAIEGKSKTISKTSSSKNVANEWDSVLDDYEKFVDKYIKLFKKAQNGDTSAITEYAECLEKAQSLQEKLQNAKSNLTSKQVSRLTKIINKLSNAVASAL